MASDNLDIVSKKKIKKLLIDSLAFLEVGAYRGITSACEAIVDIVDEARWAKQDSDDEDEDDCEDEDCDEDDW